METVMKSQPFRLLVLLALLFLLSGAGCVTPSSRMPDVLVQDSWGQPLAGARIVAHSLSISGLTAYTDARGRARIPSTIQATLWITVSHAGYQSKWIELDGSNPQVVVLTVGSDDVRPFSDWLGSDILNGGWCDPLIQTNDLWRIISP
jgi:hypothetical protein